MHGLMIAFCVFCLHCKFNDFLHIDAAVYGVLFLDSLLCFNSLRILSHFAFN